MRMKRMLLIGAALTALTTVAACDGGDAKSGGGTHSGADQQNEGKQDGGLPSASSLKKAQEFLQQHVDCSNLSNDPNDDRLNDPFVDDVSDSASAEDKREAAAWTIQEEAVCGTDWTSSYLIYRPKDMTAFEQAYKNDREKKVKRGVIDAGRTDGKFFMGKDFVVDFAGEGSGGLEKTGLLQLNCAPSFAPPSGYKKEKAHISGCVLTNYVEN
ncbi:hypothetical protein [Streptomyces violens]|uniref:hypothetical protein n=1 Tax=Streptomyces violens TaxID=66377 RepID=UPI000B0A2A69|nr:hypothetical protein [Streptomyces violens]